MDILIQFHFEVNCEKVRNYKLISIASAADRDVDETIKGANGGHPLTHVQTFKSTQVTINQCFVRVFVSILFNNIFYIFRVHYVKVL